MRKQISMTVAAIAALSIVAATAMAGDIPTVQMGSSIVGTDLTNTTAYVNGFLDSIRVVVSGSGVAYTGTLTVATENETLFTASSFSASAVYRPRIAGHNAAGAVLTGSSGICERVFLAGDKLTFTLSATSTNPLKTVAITARTSAN